MLLGLGRRSRALLLGLGRRGRGLEVAEGVALQRVQRRGGRLGRRRAAEQEGRGRRRLKSVAARSEVAIVAEAEPPSCRWRRALSGRRW